MLQPASVCEDAFGGHRTVVFLRTLATDVGVKVALAKGVASPTSAGTLTAPRRAIAATRACARDARRSRVSQMETGGGGGATTVANPIAAAGTETTAAQAAVPSDSTVSGSRTAGRTQTQTRTAGKA